ncbi:MAG: nucleotide sugar dehydrogenase [Omnitrophica bacterium]|nr:nucleotide sugar dehydrogenase [Candidatus Omnitrophota bacterium]
MKNNKIKNLKQKIKNKKANIGIVGLGYVGLPLALIFAKNGFNVTGIDIDEGRIRRIKKGTSYITDITGAELKRAVKSKKFKATKDTVCIKQLDAIIICVPTPLDRNRRPDISYIRDVAEKVKENMTAGQIIILESTTYPGTTREVLLPIFESTGLKEGEDFYLAFSPERIDPGNKIYTTENTPKIIGGISGASTELAQLLYEQVIKKVVPVSSAGAAEMVKLLENTFRIVNIALVNEIAMLSNKLNLDIWEIIDAAGTKPYGYMPFYPGPGCGGHCIPVDPLYLSWKAKQHGFKTKFINLAAYVNESMPKYIVHRLEDILSGQKKPLKNSKLLIIGIAYKKDVRDLRESPALKIIKVLKKHGAQVSYHDPFFQYLKVKGIDLVCAPLTKKVLTSRDCVVILTDHSGLDYGSIIENSKLILDTRGVLRRFKGKKSKMSKGKIFN